MGAVKPFQLVRLGLAARQVSAPDKIREVITKLKDQGRGASRSEGARDADLLCLPAQSLRQIRTNNPLERIIREIRRRTRIVGAFRDGHSALMLVAARLRHIASTKWGKRRYLAMETLLHPRPEEVAA